MFNLNKRYYYFSDFLVSNLKKNNDIIGDKIIVLTQTF